MWQLPVAAFCFVILFSLSEQVHTKEVRRHECEQIMTLFSLSLFQNAWRKMSFMGTQKVLFWAAWNCYSLLQSLKLPHGTIFIKIWEMRMSGPVQFVVECPCCPCAHDSHLWLIPVVYDIYNCCLCGVSQESSAICYCCHCGLWGIWQQLSVTPTVSVP